MVLIFIFSEKNQFVFEAGFMIKVIIILIIILITTTIIIIIIIIIIRIIIIMSLRPGNTGVMSSGG